MQSKSTRSAVKLCKIYGREKKRIAVEQRIKYDSERKEQEENSIHKCLTNDSRHRPSGPFSIQVSKDVRALRVKHLVQSSWTASSQTCGASGSWCARKC